MDLQSVDKMAQLSAGEKVLRWVGLKDYSKVALKAHMSVDQMARQKAE